jgi:integrase
VVGDGLGRDAPWVTIHTFRHTCASLLIAPEEFGGGGKNAKQVQSGSATTRPRARARPFVQNRPTALQF